MFHIFCNYSTILCVIIGTSKTLCFFKCGPQSPFLLFNAGYFDWIMYDVKCYNAIIHLHNTCIYTKIGGGGGAGGGGDTKHKQNKKSAWVF